MKPLQNPLVVSGLVLLALGLVFHSTFGSLRHWLFAARKPAVNAVTSVAPPGQPPSPVQPPAPSITDIIPGQSIDYSQVGWIRFQHRDPFGAAGDGQGGKAAGNSSRTNQPLLMLQALWQQTSRRLAVINGKVVGEGDSVAGFKVEKIEDDWVWLRGTAGLVRLDFKFNGTVPSKAGENKMNITNRAPESGPPR